MKGAGIRSRFVPGGTVGIEFSAAEGRAWVDEVELVPPAAVKK